ncbi:MAG TPA: DNA repair protein RadA [Acidimicrobiales bacterium]|nr:DNA repair protein RadA [Acidimicrobiales bacterium]
MARARTVHRCRHCGDVAARWAGRCGRCGSWNSLVEEPVPLRPVAHGRRPGPVATAVPIGQVDPLADRPRTTGVEELDRVLGGGLVAGSVTLVGGEPGIGKSTLVLQALASLARGGARCLYVSAEESAQQVRLRAERLGALQPDLWLLAEASLDGVVAAVEEVEPEVLVVDSIQTVFDPGSASAPGSVNQVRECAHRLVGLAKGGGLGEGAGSAGPSTLLVGHVTKDGELAGPRVLEHLVDTVLSFEGERHHALRLLRAVKHRFGATGTLGLFEMAGTGLVGVPDPSGLLLADRREGVPGSVVVPVLEGYRPLLVELQVLVVPSDLTVPRRSGQGIDGGRLAVVMAVLRQQLGLSVARQDVYASVVGGVRVAEPAADLGLGLALVSAVAGRPPPPGLVACGEVGLAGEVRQVNHTPRRLAEAARLGFRRAVVPRSAPDGPPGLECVRVATLAEAVAAVELGSGK